MDNMKTVMLTAGGTGGHLFPALALAEELKKRGCRTILVADKRVQTFQDFHAIDRVHTIPAGNLSGSLLRKLKGGISLVFGLLSASWLIQKYRPDVVVGFGGYPAFPAMFSASTFGVKTVMHEQNAVLGRANAVLASKVDAIALSFAETHGMDEEASEKCSVTGNPVREALMKVRDIPYVPLEEGGVLTILVLGGSLGASVFSSVLPKAVELLPANQRQRLRMIQQCRKENLESTRAAYAAVNMEVELSPFFHDVDVKLGSAQLVISRAGASSVAEIITAARPSILVPLPNAMDDHQSINANAVQDAACGWVIPEDAFSPETLATRLENFLNLPSSLNQVADTAKGIMPGNAAKKLADLVEQVIN